MYENYIIDGNAVYEIDEQCIACLAKQNTEVKEDVEKENVEFSAYI